MQLVHEATAPAHDQRSSEAYLFRKKRVHVVADPVTEVPTDAAYRVEPRDKSIALIVWQWQGEADFSACSYMRTSAARKASSPIPMPS